MSDVVTQTYRATLDFALDRLICTLKDAQTYLGGGEDNAAIGTLCTLDDEVADLQAALRLYVRSRRKS